MLALKQKLFPFFEYHSVHFTGIASLLKKTIHLIIFDKKPVIFVTANKFACLRTVRIG